MSDQPEVSSSTPAGANPAMEGWRIEGLSERRLRTPSPFRKGHRMTQEDLSKLTGLRQGQISQIETGNYFLSCEMAELLAPHFDCTPHDIRLAHNLWVALLRLDEGLGPRQAHYLATRLIEMSINTLSGSLADDTRLNVYYELLDYIEEMAPAGHPPGRDELTEE